MAESNDVSNDFMGHRTNVAQASGASQMTEWLRTRPTAAAGVAAGAAVVAGSEADPFPTDRKPPTRPSTAGTVMRNIAEMPGQAIAGVEQGLSHALGWAIDPLANWLNEHVADLSYSRDAPETTTGAITKSLSQFLTGFVPALKALKVVGATGAVGNIAAGAVADFATRDPHEKRLANLWQDLGLPKNVLTDYLASKPGDGEIEARFKSAIEATGLGAAAEGVVMGARALVASRAVKGAKQAETAALKAKYGEVTPQSYRTLGDPAKPVIEAAAKVTPASTAAARNMSAAAKRTAQVTADEVLAGRTLLEAGDDQVYINFARIDGPDEVKAVIGEMANRFRGSIDESTRGVVTQAETAKLAEDMGMTVSDVLSRQVGGTWNAETALAARKLWQASGDKLLDAAKKASDPNAGPVDLFNFRKMMATHSAIQSEVIGARTEAARALASWRIPAGGGIEQARAIEQVMGAMGGSGDAALMARRLAMLGEAGATPAVMAKFAEKGALATTVDAVREVFINGLLSSPATHVVNATSNLMVAFQQIYERGVAGQVRSLIGGGEGVAQGEATAMAYGMISSLKDAFRLGWKALKTGETGWSLNKIDLPMQNAVSAEAFHMADSGMGKVVDFLGNVFRVPGRLLGASDEFFKTINYRGELHAQALRQATSEGLKGEDLGRRIAQLVIDTPENLKINAADAALYSTFTNQPGAIGQAAMGLREKLWLSFVVIPFVRTPVNIARYGFERSPLAPLVGQWRADIAAGGARADLAVARMGTGSAILAMAADWADSGLISGQGERLAGESDTREAQMRQGWQPYSVKVGDTWYSFNRTDPLGMTLGFAADISGAIRRGEVDDDDQDNINEVTAAAITAISQVTINKTYLQGLANFTEMMADPQRYSGHYVKNLVTSFVPYTSLMGSIERAQDPIARESNTITDAVYAKIAGLSASLPPKRDLWGQPIRTDSGIGTVYDFLAPVKASGVKPNPIDTEIMRLGNGPERIKKKTTFMGVQVNLSDWPDVYDAYTALAGNELKHPVWGKGAKEFLSDVVSGKSPMSAVYKLRSDEMKADFIRQQVGQYRTLAQQQILADPKFETFAQYVGILRDDKLQKRMPVMP